MDNTIYLLFLKEKIVGKTGIAMVWILLPFLLCSFGTDAAMKEDWGKGIFRQSSGNFISPLSILSIFTVFIILLQLKYSNYTTTILVFYILKGVDENIPTEPEWCENADCSKPNSMKLCLVTCPESSMNYFVI